MTTVRSVVSDRFIRINDNLPREVCISLGSEIVNLDRAEFLAAVATELDVIVIDRADLPEVEDDGSGDLRVIPGDRPASVLPSTPGADEYRRRALLSLALAEHLEKHPPVDEAAVDALTALIRASDEAEGLVGDELDDAYHRTIARHLVKAGVRAPQAGDDK